MKKCKHEGEKIVYRADENGNKIVRVAAAVIVEDGKVFAAQRGYGKFKDGWEFPGGKIEKGETPQQAAEREVSEELGASIKVGPVLGDIEYDYPDFHLSMTCCICSLESGKLELLEHEAARWLSADELRSVDWLPADIAILDRLEAYLRSGKVD